VLDDEERILTAGALLDHLMADVSMDDALGLAAALDRALDVPLQSQALGALLDGVGAPGAGEALGRALDVVLTGQRVDLYVHTMDAVRRTTVGRAAGVLWDTCGLLWDQCYTTQCGHACTGSCGCMA
jgi:hypothetical protein